MAICFGGLRAGKKKSKILLRSVSVKVKKANAMKICGKVTLPFSELMRKSSAVISIKHDGPCCLGTPTEIIK